ncbi:hypothetical protein UFOVP1264_30 [uncultured Caudovirales phage]|uniref:Uncharacterized protein n=1 Tax=uncultured Caudovirales phage TaxID=2100421 RepID=A0A6J5RQG3_9CAUD|nr:hypothetical protein UFOVP1264_30 [uncultured Caudovirales phage]
MTISQSRYGSMAEVGRAPQNKKQKESANLGGLAASAGAIGAGGYGIKRSANYAQFSRSSANQAKAKNSRRKNNLSEMKRIRNENAVHVKNNERFAQYWAGPKTKGAKFVAPGQKALVIKPGAGPRDAEPIGRELSERSIRNNSKMTHLSSHNKELARESKRYSSMSNYARGRAIRFGTGGAALSALGVAGAAGIIRRNEKKRGTLSGNRSALGQMKPQANAPRSLESDKARRLNGM